MPVPDRTRYEAIAHTLLTGISSGKYPPGSLLPTEAQLCADYGVSRETVRSAMRQLIDLGMVTRRKGIGTRVEEREAPPLGFQNSLASIDDIVHYAEDTTRDIRGIETVVADRALAAAFGCKPGSRWNRVSYLRYRADQALPISWVDVYIDERFSSLLPLLRDYRGLYGTLIEERYGVRIAAIRQEVRGILMPAALSDALSAATGSAALQVVRHYLDRKSGLLEFSVTVHPADRCTISTTLRRVAAG
jgi:GntR family transcriptional regulator